MEWYQITGPALFVKPEPVDATRTLNLDGLVSTGDFQGFGVLREDSPSHRRLTEVLVAHGHATDLANALWQVREVAPLVYALARRRGGLFLPTTPLITMDHTTEPSEAPDVE